MFVKLFPTALQCPLVNNGAALFLGKWSFQKEGKERERKNSEINFTLDTKLVGQRLVGDDQWSPGEIALGSQLRTPLWVRESERKNSFINPAFKWDRVWHSWSWTKGEDAFEQWKKLNPIHWPLSTGASKEPSDGWDGGGQLACYSRVASRCPLGPFHFFCLLPFGRQLTTGQAFRFNLESEKAFRFCLIKASLAPFLASFLASPLLSFLLETFFLPLTLSGQQKAASASKGSLIMVFKVEFHSLVRNVLNSLL